MIKLVVKWRLSKESGIAVLLLLRFTAGIDAPAVTNDQHDWAGHINALCRRL